MELFTVDMVTVSNGKNPIIQTITISVLIEVFYLKKSAVAFKLLGITSWNM